MLSDRDVRAAMARNDLAVDRDGSSVDPAEFRGCSIDLSLAPEYYRWRAPKALYGKRHLDLARVKQDQLEELLSHCAADEGEGIRIEPGEFILARTVERVRLNGALAGLLTGRSSYSRLGLTVEFSQNLLCPGHNNFLPLQLKNNTPYSLTIYPRTPICQLVVLELSSAADLPYDRDPNSKYAMSNNFLSRWYRDMNVSDTPAGKVERKLDLRQLLTFVLLVSAVLSIASISSVVLLEDRAAKVAKNVALLPSVSLLLLAFIVQLILFVRDLRHPDGSAQSS